MTRLVTLGIDRQNDIDLASLLAELVELGGSDLLLKAGNRPLVRVGGALQPLDIDHEIMSPGQTEQLLYRMISTGKIKRFETDGEIDFAYSAPGIGRFRVAGYMQRGSVSIAMRMVPSAHSSIESLGLPEVLRRLAEEERGLILVTGGTGSGKSTTLAAMIAHVNETLSKHIITVEDPIEYLHRDRRSAIDQREIGGDTVSFGSALRRVLRQDPDVILIGEMRDEETVRTALAAAETGHLVMSTLHTLDAAETINRIIDFFQPHEHQHVRAMLAGTLQGIISQRLAPTADGEGRVAVCEVMTMTGRVRDTILDAGSDVKLSDIIVEGEFYGMQTFDQALYKALNEAKIDMDTALRISSRPHDLKLLIHAGGRTSTSMDDLDDRLRIVGDAPEGAESEAATPTPSVDDRDAQADASAFQPMVSTSPANGHDEQPRPSQPAGEPARVVPPPTVATSTPPPVGL